MKKKKKKKTPSIIDMIQRTSLPERGIQSVKPVSGRKPVKLVKLGNLTVRVYSVGWLADRLDRDPATIRRWQRAQIVPPPLIRTKDGIRWYLIEEIDAYERVIKQCKVRNGMSIADTGFSLAIKAEIAAVKRRLEETLRKKEKELDDQSK